MSRSLPPLRVFEKIASTCWSVSPRIGIPLQLLAYHTARQLGLNVDQPRNLAKTVTVE